MLYKKYHRNFARQFKKGTRFFIGNYSCNGEVTKSCYIMSTGEKGVYISEKDRAWTVVFPGGKINKFLHVIQEIS